MCRRVMAAFVLLLVLCTAGGAYAHFGMVIPSDEIVSKDEPRDITIELMFMHPFEGTYMDMARPRAFGVQVGGFRRDLTDTLVKKTVKGRAAWEAIYKIKRPGDHVFYVLPEPYFEPAEGKLIAHYTKVVVDALGLEQGWDAELGQRAEVVPLTRPYGLWAGNVFQGIVKLDGAPVPYAEVEVEYYNPGGRVKAPADPYVTQLIKADGAGVFTYAMPRAGWWGFAALMTDGRKLAHTDGGEYPAELGAVIWVRAREMK